MIFPSLYVALQVCINVNFWVDVMGMDYALCDAIECKLLKEACLLWFPSSWLKPTTTLVIIIAQRFIKHVVLLKENLNTHRHLLGIHQFKRAWSLSLRQRYLCFIPISSQRCAAETPMSSCRSGNNACYFFDLHLQFTFRFCQLLFRE